jgi:hypothetical protein
VADCAQPIGLDLDGVPAPIHAGKSFAYRHEGILFVGDKRPDAPVGAGSPSVSGDA